MTIMITTNDPRGDSNRSVDSIVVAVFVYCVVSMKNGWLFMIIFFPLDVTYVFSILIEVHTHTHLHSLQIYIHFKLDHMNQFSLQSSFHKQVYLCLFADCWSRQESISLSWYTYIVDPFSFESAE